MLGGFHSFGPGGYAATPLAEVLPVEMNRLERQNFGEAIRSECICPSNLEPEDASHAHWAVAQHSAIGVGGRKSRMLGGAASLDGANRLDHAQARRHGIGRDGRWSSAIDRARLRAGPRAGVWRRLDMALVYGRATRRRTSDSGGKSCCGSRQGSIDRELGVGQPRRAPFQPRRPRRVHGRRANPQGEPIADASYEVEVLRPDGSKGSHACGTRRDEMAGTYPEDAIGRRLHADREGIGRRRRIGTAQARFLVYDQDLELDNPAADRGMIESLASMTSGRTVAADQLGQMFASIREQLEQLEVETMAKRTLWDTWPFFLLLIALLGVEWWLRKKWGLV